MTPFDDTRERDYTAASCAMARASRDAALARIWAFQDDFHIIRDGLVSVDARDAIPTLEVGVWDLLEELVERMGGSR